MLGDSLTAGYQLPAEDAFPARLEAALSQRGHDVEVLNAGVSGDTSAGGLARLDWSLADHPQLMVVALGANDALRGLPPQQTEKNLAAILERLQQVDVTPILAGMKAPRNLGEAYYSSFDALYPRLAKEFQVPFYPFLLSGVAGRPEMNLADGIHPNRRGIAQMVEGILPLVEIVLSRISIR